MMRFMADHMLIKLGKDLRIAGYDAEWDPLTGSEHAIRTHELINRANTEGRVFLNRNTRLRDQYPAPDQCVCITESDPVKQLHEPAGRMGLDVKAPYVFQVRKVQCRACRGSREKRDRADGSSERVQAS